tara:strand:- start:530 stop:1699 length:1170 start_codon:yes stop_codon:yes gene_type:complete
MKYKKITLKFKMKIMKKIIILLITSLTIFGCSGKLDFIKEIPLSDVKSHWENLSGLEESDLKKSSETYIELLNLPENANKPQIFFYLHLSGNDTFLSTGLNKFPNDPYLNFIKSSNIEDIDIKIQSYFNILDSFPHHEITLNDLILNIISIVNQTEDEKIRRRYLIPFSSRLYDFNNLSREIQGDYNFVSNFNRLPQKDSVDFIKNRVTVSSLIKEMELLYNQELEIESICSGSEIRDFVSNQERIRLSKFSDLSYDSPSVEYIDDCTFSVSTHVHDKKVMEEFDIVIDYQVDPWSEDYEDFTTSNGKFLNRKPKGLTKWEVEGILEKFLDNNSRIHGVMGLYLVVSNPEIGLYNFYGSICYGNSEYNCEYQNVYISTQNYGKTWSFEF